MVGRVEKINADIMKQCREQAGLDMADIAKKIKKIAEIESGTHKPTFKQLNTLSNLYNVPRWVFISEQLPDKYRFEKAVPAFRQFAANNEEIFYDSKVRCLTARVERFRNLILDLLNDMGEAVTHFDPPQLKKSSSPESVAKLVRSWLGIEDEQPDFAEWKKLLENKGVFVFLTSKYKGWSHVNKKLIRGLSIYHSTLPIIIINDSDAKKAQSFTLFHELAHLLRKESAIDDWKYHNRPIEKWCDELAGNVLMPSTIFKSNSGEIDDLSNIKHIAKNFRVSSYSCLVRLRQLGIIDQTAYMDFEKQLIDEYEKLQRKLKQSDGGPARNRSQEVLKQYGHIYTNVLFQAYHSKEIGLHKLTQFFDLKKTSYVFEIEGQL